MSDQPKWTPGTWVALSASGNAADPLQIVASAPVWAKDSKLIASGFQNINPEASANLHLIAAAPELYTALEAMLKCETDHGGIGGAGICITSKDMARVALAKAKGETAAPADRAIEMLNLNTRTLNCLKKANIQTIRQLTQKTEAEVLRVPGIWRAGFHEIRDALKAQGLTLRPTA